MSREMVEIRLYENGEYTITDISPIYATQRLYGIDDKGTYSIYHCKKSMWKTYLLKLANSKDIDKQIAELNRKKRNIENLRTKLIAELSKEQSYDKKRSNTEKYSEEPLPFD